MRKIVALLLICMLLLSGCSNWLKSSYSSVKPHEEPLHQQGDPEVSVSNSEEMRDALISVIEAGAESGVVYIRHETEDSARQDMDRAISDVCTNNPFAAYSVEKISYAFGNRNGRKAMSIQVDYLPNRIRADKILRIETLEQVEEQLTQRLDACDAAVVLYLDNPEQVDYAQIVEDYAITHPEKVMESPDVTVNLYPELAQQQVVEIKFTYQTSRAELRTLQNKVAPVFASAAQYVTGEWTPTEKAQRLYAFLMERYAYNIQTSITPAYSLLLHGVGDSRAFATVYAAMCRQAELDCRMVTGTRNGTAWVWNAVQIDGEYYYIDLLFCNENGGFRLSKQEEMPNYVWDYSAYPMAE